MDSNTNVGSKNTAENNFMVNGTVPIYIVEVRRKVGVKQNV